MTIRIINRVVDSVNQKAPTNKAGQKARSAGGGNTTSSMNLSRNVAQGEASVAHLRFARTGSESGRIKEYKEAKGVAEDVSERVKEEGDAGDTHAGLSDVSSRDHLSD